MGDCVTETWQEWERKMRARGGGETIEKWDQ